MYLMNFDRVPALSEYLLWFTDTSSGTVCTRFKVAYLAPDYAAIFILRIACTISPRETRARRIWICIGRLTGHVSGLNSGFYQTWQDIALMYNCLNLTSMLVLLKQSAEQRFIEFDLFWCLLNGFLL